MSKLRCIFIDKEKMNKVHNALSDFKDQKLISWFVHVEAMKYLSKMKGLIDQVEDRMIRTQLQVLSSQLTNYMNCMEKNLKDKYNLLFELKLDDCPLPCKNDNDDKSSEIDEHIEIIEENHEKANSLRYILSRLQSESCIEYYDLDLIQEAFEIAISVLEEC